MKIAYATLAGSAMAAQPLRSFVEAKVNEVFQETEDGFKINAAPYLLAEWNGQQGLFNMQHSIDGVHMENDNVQMLPNGIHFFGTNYGANAAALGMPAGQIINKVTYDAKCTGSANAAGVNGKCDREMNVNFNDGSDGSFTENIGLSASMSQTGKAVSVEISVDGERETSDLDQLKNYPVWYLVRDYTLDIDTEIKVNDVNACMEMSAGCGVSIESSIDAPADNFNSDVKLSFGIKKFAAVWKVEGSDVDTQIAFLRKVDRAGKGMALSKTGGWWSVHAAEANNWQKALRQNRDVLVIQVPTVEQWEQDAYPELEALASPFIQFGGALIQHANRIPYVIYYLDDFFATFDNEFDCSAYVEAVNVESDLLAELVGASSFNSFMSQGCKQVNAAIVEALQCPELDAGMGEMRSYVSHMNSAAGAAEFQSLFGGIF